MNVTTIYQGQTYPGGTQVVRVIGMNADPLILNSSMEYSFSKGDGTRLSYAILRHLGGDKLAVMVHKDFAEKVVSKLPKEGLFLSKEEIIEMYAAEFTLLALGNIKK